MRMIERCAKVLIGNAEIVRNVREVIVEEHAADPLSELTIIADRQGAEGPLSAKTIQISDRVVTFLEGRVVHYRAGTNTGADVEARPRRSNLAARCRGPTIHAVCHGAAREKGEGRHQ